MKVMKLNSLLALLTLMACSQVRTIAGEGNGSSGGGDVLICGKTVYLADTFGIRRSAYMEYYGTLTEKEIVTAFEEKLKIANFAETYKKLTYVPVKDVAELDDDNLTFFGKKCIKKQLAIQYIEQGKVEYSEKLHSRLSRLEKTLFKVHETLISLKKSTLANTNDTTPIRDEVKGALSEYHTFQKILAEVAKNVNHATEEKKISFLVRALIGACQGADNCDPTYLTVDKIINGENYPKQMFQEINDYYKFAYTFSRVLNGFSVYLQPTSITQALNQENLIEAIQEMSKQAVFDIKY